MIPINKKFFEMADGHSMSVRKCSSGDGRMQIRVIYEDDKGTLSYEEKEIVVNNVLQYIINKTPTSEMDLHMSILVKYIRSILGNRNGQLYLLETNITKMMDQYVLGKILINYVSNEVYFHRTYGPHDIFVTHRDSIVLLNHGNINSSKFTIGLVSKTENNILDDICKYITGCEEYRLSVRADSDGDQLWNVLDNTIDECFYNQSVHEIIHFLPSERFKCPGVTLKYIPHKQEVIENNPECEDGVLLGEVDTPEGTFKLGLFKVTNLTGFATLYFELRPSGDPKKVLALLDSLIDYITKPKLRRMVKGAFEDYYEVFELIDNTIIDPEVSYKCEQTEVLDHNERGEVVYTIDVEYNKNVYSDVLVTKAGRITMKVNELANITRKQIRTFSQNLLMSSMDVFEKGTDSIDSLITSLIFHTKNLELAKAVTEDLVENIYGPMEKTLEVISNKEVDSHGYYAIRIRLRNETADIKIPGNTLHISFGWNALNKTVYEMTEVIYDQQNTFRAIDLDSTNTQNTWGRRGL